MVDERANPNITFVMKYRTSYPEDPKHLSEVVSEIVGIRQTGCRAQLSFFVLR